MSTVKILLSRTGWNKTKVTKDVDLILLTLTAGFALVYYIVKFKHKPKYCKMLTEILFWFHFGYTFGSSVYLAYLVSLVRKLYLKIWSFIALHDISKVWKQVFQLFQNFQILSFKFNKVILFLTSDKN